MQETELFYIKPEMVINEAQRELILSTLRELQHHYKMSIFHYDDVVKKITKVA